MCGFRLDARSGERNRGGANLSLTGVGGFIYTLNMSYRPGSSAVSFSTESRRTFYEAHPSIALFMLIAVFTAPFAGLYVAGLLGVVIGVLVSAAAYVLTPCFGKWLGG